MLMYAMPGLLLLGAVLFLVVLLHRRLFAKQRGFDFDVEWIEQFSASRYRPIERLFNSDDYDFLAAQRGYRPELEKKLRAERRRLFRNYLRTMRADFERLMASGNLLYLASPQPNPQFAAALYRNHVSFQKRYYYAHILLILQDLHLAQADASGLLNLLDSVGGQVRDIMAQPSFSGAA